MDSPIDRLIEFVFHLDEPSSSGVIHLRTGRTSVRIQVSGGCLEDSFLEGPGQTFTDFLLESGAVSREDYERSLNVAKEQDITLFQALERMGAVGEERLRSARQDLSARRLAESLGEGLDMVELEPWHADAAAPDPDRRLATILLSLMRTLHEQGKLPAITPPAYALVRPTERLGRYIAELREILGPLPLPRVGGETYEVLVERHGQGSLVALSLLMRAGMLMTEFGTPGLEVVPRLEGLASLLGLEARLLIGQVRGGAGGRTSVHRLLGDLWMDRFGALEEARRCYLEAEGAGDPDPGRRLQLALLSPLEDPSVKEMSYASTVRSPGDELDAGLLRILACRMAASGAYEDALLTVHEALRRDPAAEDTLVLLVQLLEDHAESLHDVQGVEPLGIISDAARCAREMERPDLAIHLLSQGQSIMPGSSDLLEQAMELYRQRGWSPDLIEVVVDFACDASRKGWTNPLWSLGGYITRAGESIPLRLVIDIYEILVKASPNRREALDKLVRMVEGLGQPNLLLDLLERSLEVLSEDEDLAGIYARLARLYLDQFGDLKEASRYASHCLMQRPEHAGTVELVVKAARAGKLSRSSGYRFAKAMSRLSAIPTPEKLEWLMRAARIAEKELKDLPLALSLLRRILGEYGRDAAGRDVRRDIARLEGTISGLAGERKALKDGQDLGALARRPERVLSEAEALKRLARISLQFEDGRDEACGLLEILLDAGVSDWDAVELALVKIDDEGLRRRLIEKVAASLESGPETPPPLPLLEEMAEAWREVGGPGEDDMALLDAVHRAILAVSPFHRESVRHLGLRASQAGDVDRIVQFTERRIATARPQERGNLYVELASYGDLIEEYESRAPTFWRIGSNAMPSHPSVLANDFVELIGQERWSEASAWLETNVPHFPRARRPQIYTLMRVLSDRAGDATSSLETALRALRHSPWNQELALEVLARAGEDGQPGALGEALDSLLVWHHLDPGMPSRVDRAFARLAASESSTDDLVRCARHLVDLPLPGSPALASLLENVATLLAGRGRAEVASDCIERALVATSDPERRADLVLKLADLFDSMGEKGLERLLVTLMRARRAGASRDVVTPWVTRALERSSLDWTSTDVLRTVFAENVGPEEYAWVDVLVAMFLGLVLWEEERAQGVLREAEAGGGGQIVKLAAAALHGLAGDEEDTEEALVRAASVESDGAQRAGLLIRISQMKKQRGLEEEAADAAIEALSLCPDNGEFLAQAEELGRALKDAGRLLSIYELAQSNLPGKKSEQAFHFRFAKAFEELFGDRPGAMDMYLRSLAIQPKPGATLEAVERLSHTMQKHGGLVRAAGLLARAGKDRRAVGAFIARHAELFLEEENLASAYHLVLDAVTQDPGLDLLDEVRLMADRSQAGKASATKIVHRWVPLLEQAILERGDDIDLPKRLDAVAELKHLLVEGPVRDSSAAEQTRKRHSIPPEADAGWESVGQEGPEEAEITFEQQPVKVPPPVAVKEEPRAEALEKALEDSKVTLMPKPRADQAEAVRQMPPSEPPPPVQVSEEKSRDLEPAEAPPPPAVPVQEVDQDRSPTTRADAGDQAPRPRLGKRRHERLFHNTAPMPVVSVPPRTDTPAGRRARGRPVEVEEPADEGSVPTARQWSSGIVEAIGKREEVEPEVIVRDEPEPEPVVARALTSPPGVGTLEELRRIVRPDAEDEEEDYSVEIMVGEDRDFPVQLTDEEVEEERATIPPAAKATRVVPAAVPAAGDLEAVIEEPWDLDLVRRTLGGRAGDGRGAAAMLRSLLSLADRDPRTFRPKRPVFKDSRSTLEAFKNLLTDEPRYRVLRVLGVLWDVASQLFKERIGDYEMRTADQITPFSTGPVAPILEKAIRSLGYVRMAVYYRRERRYTLHVVRTTPPSVAVFLPLGRLPLSLEFYLARCFWAVNPRRILAYSLDPVAGQRTVDAVFAAFGPASGRIDRVEPEVSSLTQDLWSLVPQKAQGRLRSLLENADPVDFRRLQRETKLECSRAGVLFSGDLASAVRHLLPDDVPTTSTGSIPEEELSEAIRLTRPAQDMIRFCLDGGVLSFFDRVLS